MLTDAQARQAKAKDKDYKLSDSGGLYLFVSKTGHKTWRLKYRYLGKEKRLMIGSRVGSWTTFARILTNADVRTSCCDRHG